VRHLYFLNTDTGEEKICKAEGAKWGFEYAFYPEMSTPKHQIYFGWGIYSDANKEHWIKSGRRYLSFDEIPLELGILIGE